jgi:energy-coupling factor transporter ATP-binding protein EcfA2
MLDLSETRTPTMDVVMLGPRGSGKSSLIAAMYGQLRDTVRDTGLSLTSDKMSDLKLQDIHQRLASCVQGADALQAGIPGTRTSQRYHFTLVEHRDGGKDVPALNFDFVDYPGNWIDDLDNDEDDRIHRERTIEAIGNAAVIIIAVDTPYLMADVIRYGDTPGNFHYSRNRPDAIECILREAFAWNDRQADRGAALKARLVMFVPIRGEKWVRSAGGRLRVVEAIKTGYAGTLKFLASADNTQRVTVVTTPVMTTGCVEFDSWEESPEEGALPSPKFVLTEPAEFKPQFCDQPIYYMFRFAIEEYHRQRSSSIGQALKYIIDNDIVVRRSAALFAARCLEEDGFQVLQGKFAAGQV